jgi:hypothetical protein
VTALAVARDAITRYLSLTVILYVVSINMTLLLQQMFTYLH